MGKKFFWISCIWNIVQTWLLVRPFVYLSSFISQILDFLYWMVCIFIFMASQWKQRMDYFDDQHTITVPMVNLVLNSCHIYLFRAQKSLKTQQCTKCESCFIVFRTEKGYSKNCPCYNHYYHNFVGQLPVLEIHQKLLTKVLLSVRLSKCIINNFANIWKARNHLHLSCRFKETIMQAFMMTRDKHGHFVLIQKRQFQTSPSR